MLQIFQVQTTDYCEDVLVTEHDLLIESWDGRDKHEWRPHHYDATGRRMQCAIAGSDRETAYWSEWLGQFDDNGASG